ncbi:rubrerythrin-like domain-containing protein [Haloferax sp. DFSO52]|uniref:rubrerythrin-like domain-containing protein n=1 Tax=Haloferax sp. DFSO52 TaxID=3388505 RepID=UPI003A848CEA
MAMYNSLTGGWTVSGGYFECRSCGTRTVSERFLAVCPNCGGSVRNIAVARE